MVSSTFSKGRKVSHCSDIGTSLASKLAVTLKDGDLILSLGPVETYLESARVVGVSLMNSVIIGLSVWGGDFSDMAAAGGRTWEIASETALLKDNDYCGNFISYGI